jgi:hypothetical protein
MGIRRECSGAPSVDSAKYTWRAYKALCSIRGALPFFYSWRTLDTGRSEKKNSGRSLTAATLNTDISTYTDVSSIPMLRNPAAVLAIQLSGPAFDTIGHEYTIGHAYTLPGESAPNVWGGWGEVSDWTGGAWM